MQRKTKENKRISNEKKSRKICSSNKQRFKKRYFWKSVTKIPSDDTKKILKSQFWNEIEKVVVAYYTNQVFRGKISQQENGHNK